MLRYPPRLPSLSRLRAFEQVAASGAMGAAAGMLHISQSAVTRAVSSLEAELGAQLLDRRRSGSFLTQEGMIFERRTRRLFQQLHAAIGACIGEDGHGDGTARLARKIGDVHMRSLIAIWKSRSFRAAARALDVAEPTLHRPARELERLLKVPLYRRTPEGLGLTPAGAELARRFALSVAEIMDGIDELSAHRGSVAMSATIGVLPLAPKRFLAVVAEDLLRLRPHSRLVIQESDYDDLVVGLRSGAIDLIFGALRAPPRFADLQEEILFEDPYRIVCRRDHPLTRIRRPSPSDLRHYDWVFPTTMLPRRAVLGDVIAAWKLSPRVQIETNSLGTLIADLSVSDHISLLPRECIAADDQIGQLAALDLHVPHPTRNVGITTRADWLPTAFQSELLLCLRQAARTTRQGLAGRPAS